MRGTDRIRAGQANDFAYRQADERYADDIVTIDLKRARARFRSFRLVRETA
jgi:hypothetical protein